MTQTATEAYVRKRARFGGTLTPALRSSWTTLAEEAEAAFRECHHRAYWSDSNPRPPQGAELVYPRGHDRDFTDCRDPECVMRRELLEMDALQKEMEAAGER